MTTVYEMANGRTFLIAGWDRATAAELLALHGSTPRR